MDKWTLFALALIFIGNIGGILIVFVQSKNSAADKDQIIQTANSNNEYLKGQLNEITKERELLKVDLGARDIENKNKSEEIIQLNKELLKKSEELNKFLGGSDAYPILLVSSMNSKTGESGFTFKISNEFDYPIYDIEINVFDFQFIIDNSNREGGVYVITKENFTKSILFAKADNHLKSKSELLTPKVFQIKDGIFYVKLACRGSFVFEKIAFVRIGNVIAHGFVVYDDNGKILKKWYGQNPSNEIKLKLDAKFNLIPDNVELKFIN